MMNREQLLGQWRGYIVKAAHRGKLTGGKPCQIRRVYPVAGPRAGALELLCAGLGSGALLRALSRSDCANLRQLTPWDFVGDPQVFMRGRFVRVEAGWPDELAESLIRLADLGEHPHGGGRWVAGKSERGDTIIPGLNDKAPHFLIAGATGSGKSVALRSAVLQLSADPDNSIVLADGKMGESLRAVERLPGVIGPCAVEGLQVRAALGWAAAQMRQRYEAGYYTGRVVVVFDEFQEMAGDAVVADLLRKLAAQGRAAGVHLLAATQHPVVSMFGDPSTRRNLVGKLALRVADADASRVAVGGATPRADHLLGAGDCYIVKPGACHRVQGVYIDEKEITAAEGGGPAWRFQRWPEYAPEDVGQEIETVNWSYTGDELAVSLVSAASGEGRTRMVNRLSDAQLGRPGAERAIRLLRLGRDANDWLVGNGYAVCLSADTVSDPRNVRIEPDVW